MQVTNATEQQISGTYGHLTITYRRLTYTWTVTVYAGPTRINELCGAWDDAQAAYREAQRIARAAHNGTHIDDVIAAKPSELALAAVRDLLDTVPVSDFRPVRATRTLVFRKPLSAPQCRAVTQHRSGRVYPGNGVLPATLAAIEDKGYGTAVRGVDGRRPHQIAYVELNDAGLKVAGAASIAA